MDSIETVGNYYLELCRNDTTPNTKIQSTLYWLCKCIVADKEALKKELDNPISADLFYFFTENHYERLRDYLRTRYDLDNKNSKSDFKSKKNMLYYKDLLMLNTPDREGWDSASKIMSYLPLKRGDNVIDWGCGFGYYTFQLAKIVGEEGKVFATDIDTGYINHLNIIVNKAGVKNIIPLLASPNDISVYDSVDVVFISKLYHDFYVISSNNQRAELISSIKRVLKKGGYFIIADNLRANGIELNSRFVDKRLIIAQLAYWGFSYIDYIEFSNQCYVLIFKNDNEKVKEQTLYADKSKPLNTFLLNVNSEKSLLKFSDVNSDDFIKKDLKEAAKMAYNYFETGRIDFAAMAIEMYEKIIPCENHDAVYSTIKWLCEVKSNTNEVKNSILEKDTLSRVFYMMMTNNNDSLIKCYLKQKYNIFDTNTSAMPIVLSEKIGVSLKSSPMITSEDYMRIFNPAVEKSNLIIDNLNLQKEQVVATMGNTLGFFSYRFSQLVGEAGRVYVVEPNTQNNWAIENFVNEWQIHNIEVIKNTSDTFSLKKKADTFFLFSFYHTLYGFLDTKREAYIKSIKENLKTGGKLIIADSDPSGNLNLQYNGEYINKKLIEYQLAFYGFVLLNDSQINPQHYMLTFQLKAN